MNPTAQATVAPLGIRLGRIVAGAAGLALAAALGLAAVVAGVTAAVA